MKAIDFFKIYFDNEVLGEILTNSWRYCTKKLSEKQKQKDLNSPEIDILNEEFSQLIIEEAKEDEKESKVPEIINSKKIKEIDMIELEAYIGVILRWELIGNQIITCIGILMDYERVVLYQRP
ncbi:unnamed protein product [Blepharisma stoltei]|uniref:Uncharacterized protein n=1 Tax=Blepharisma stoltei TaxID=1481888 RepID=A0AAU9KJ92_9CILI|nr:unnamed protein product [Blepharisma stoltei]